MTYGKAMFALNAVRAGTLIEVSSAAVALALALGPNGALAQSPAAPASQPEDPAVSSADRTSEIVVTGTLIRGAAPTGTNVISVGAEQVSETGATTTAQLLQSIPQLGSFGSLQFPVGSGNSVTVNRPNLRSLPGFNTSGGSTTLVLLDGHRLVGSGVITTTPDPDAIPPGAIERLEVVPDGGSAVYGSDAVAGVLNFITRKRFDGVKVDAHYGFADDYYQWDASVTAGKDWGSGSLYVSYNFSKHDDIFGRDRDYIRQFPDPSSGLLSIQCNPGTVAVGGVNYGLPFVTGTAVAGTPNQCDTTNDGAFYPRERRHSVFASLYQELNDSLSIDLKAYYTNRQMAIVYGPFRQTQNVTSASPFFAAHRIGVETSQSVNFAFGANDSSTQRIGLETWGVTPTITAKLGNSWQVRLLANFGESDTSSNAAAFNTNALTNAINAGYFNPYAPYDTTPANYAAALGAILNWETYGRGRQYMANFRAVADGELFDLPGGAVKLAFGAEHYHEKYSVRLGTAVPGTAAMGYAGLSIGGTTIMPAVAPLPLRQSSRNVKSAFGELIVPIFGSGNATTLLNELTFSASGRYDHYSDVGGTFNPKFGITWRPTEWLKFRGAYGQSFNAPSLADAPSADLTSVFLLTTGLPTGTLLASQGGPYPVPTAGQVGRISVRGNAPGITPQTAKTWSAGFDLTPLSGISLSATYYRIALDGVIGVPPAQNSVLIYREYSNLVRVNDGSPAFTQAVVDLINSASPGALTNTIPGCNPATPAACVPLIYAITDVRKQNLGDFQVSGIDFSLEVNREVGFGSVSFGLNGTYELTRKQKTPTGTAYIDLLSANNSRLFFRANAGLGIGNFYGQVAWNHRGGYNLDPAVGFVPQSRVGAYNVFDLFFRYDMKGAGLAKDLQLTLNVNNVFNSAPPEFRGAATPITGVANGMTIGRLVQFGVSKRF